MELSPSRCFQKLICIFILTIFFVCLIAYDLTKLSENDERLYIEWGIIEYVFADLW